MANVSAIHAAITLGATSQTITTDITNPTFARALSVTGTAGGATALTGDVTITGTSDDGDILVETFALDGSNTVVGKYAFATVTSIVVPAKKNTGDTVSVGVAWQLFGVAEARAFNRAELASTTTYTAAAITEAEREIRDAFEQVCGVSFVPKTCVDYYVDGTGGRVLWLPFVRLKEVTAAVIYDSDMTVVETFDADDLADLALYDDGRIVRRTRGYWTAGERNVRLTFTHGYGACPLEIRRAALSVCLAKLVPSDVSDRATYVSDGNMTFGLATAGRFGAEYGLPMVDSTLSRYSSRTPAIA